MREEFEAWALEMYYEGIDKALAPARASYDPSRYFDDDVDNAWKGWQAGWLARGKQGAGDLTDLVNWLNERAAECRKNAKSRRGAAGNRDATEAELKADKAMAEKMFGRKLDLVSTKPKDNARAHDIQLRIADKLETEARQLSNWADLLLGVELPAAPTETGKEQG